MVPVTPHGTRNTSKKVLRDLYEALKADFPIQKDFAEEFGALLTMASTPIDRSWPVWNCSINPHSQGTRQWHVLKQYGSDGPGPAWDISSVIPPEEVAGSSRLSLVSPDYARMVFPADFGTHRLNELMRSGDTSSRWSRERATRDNRTLTDPPRDWLRQRNPL